MNFYNVLCQNLNYHSNTIFKMIASIRILMLASVYISGLLSSVPNNTHIEIVKDSHVGYHKISTGDNFHIGQVRAKRNLQGVAITQHFSERTTSSGADISLQCAASAQQPPNFEWERDSTPITPNADARYIIGQVMTLEGTVLSHLNISKLRVEDGGAYTCKATSGDVSVMHTDRINVYGVPYIRSLPPIKVQSGESVQIKCPYYGYPISSVEWEIRGKTVSSRYRRHTTRGSDLLVRSRRSNVAVVGDGVLTIEKVTSDDSGSHYTCEVQSPSGEMARRTFEIQVIEGPQLDDLFLGTNLQEGQIVQINCQLRSGDTPIYFSWLKDGKKIPSNLKVEEKTSELFSVLVIKRVSLEHCGTYTCVAMNHVAKVNRSAELYIKVAPKWITEPANTSLLIDEKGSVDCSASGYPQPQVHWMKRDGMSAAWRPVLDLTDGGALSLPNGSLIIQRVSSSDAGQYSCGVENGVGQPLNKNIWITVNRPARFSVGSSAVTSRSGHPTTITCTACGDFPITLEWINKERKLEYAGPRFKLSQTNTEKCLTSGLAIEYTQVTDSGTYQCRASNQFGVDTHLLDLTVQEPPTPPSQLSVWQTKSRSAQITWVQPRAHEIITHYVIKYVLMGSNEVKTVNVTRTDNDIRQSADLTDLKPSNGYSVRVAAANEIDMSEFSSPVIFNTLEEAPSSPPTNVVVDPTENPGELLISWLPPNKASHNGILLGYYVKIVPQSGGYNDEADTRTVKATSQNSKQETLITGLKKNMKYAVTISAFNAADKGPFTLPVYQYTREGAPEQSPSSVDCTASTSTSLKVTWTPIPNHDHGGSLLGYHIIYAGEEDGIWKNLTTVSTEASLHGLLEFTNYTVRVAGFTNYGQGPMSYPVTCTTLEDVPEPPSASKAIVSSPTSLIISWKQPRRPNGVIQHYNIYYHPRASSEKPSVVKVPATNDVSEWKTLYQEINGLLHDKEYEVWISATSNAGESHPTPPIVIAMTYKIKAGIWSLGGPVRVRNGGVSLPCAARGTPRPNAAWTLNQRPLHNTNHYTVSDLALLIRDPDESLNGNYTCIAKNLYGNDMVTYLVEIPSLPITPALRAVPSRHSITIMWDQQGDSQRDSAFSGYTYSLTWREQNGHWNDPVSNDLFTLNGRTYKYTLNNLQCGTKYTFRITSSNKIGTSQPGYLDESTIGGAPKAPSTLSMSERFWSNCSHIYVQMTGWDDNGCEINQWLIEFREIRTDTWTRAENSFVYADLHTWVPRSDHYLPSVYAMPKSFVLSDLYPGVWYQIRITATNDAGSVTGYYTYATKTLDGLEISPLPADNIDLSIAVIICSCILLILCAAFCIFIALKKARHNRLREYRSSVDYDKSESVGQLSQPIAQTTITNYENYHHNPKERVYSTPVNVRKTITKPNEMYEINPYAQFTVGFRTFGHSENQSHPTMAKAKRGCYNNETSFQACSESEDSDSVSKTTTLKSIAGKANRRTHHHR